MDLVIKPEYREMIAAVAKDVGISPQQALEHILDCYLSGRQQGPIVPRYGDDVELWDPFAVAA
jgi:hypothetical protein